MVQLSWMYILESGKFGLNDEVLHKWTLYYVGENDGLQVVNERFYNSRPLSIFPLKQQILHKEEELRRAKKKVGSK